MKTQKKKLNGDGTVFYLEKERKWRAEITWVDGGGNKHRKSWKATKQADVKEKLAEFKRQLLLNSTQIPTENQTFREFADEWVNVILKPKVKPLSYQRKVSTLENQVYDHIGGIPIDKLTHVQIQRMVNNLSQSGLSYSTVKKAYEAVSGCLRYYRIKTAKSFNPCEGITLPENKRKDNSDITFFSEEERKQIVNEATRQYESGKYVYRLGWVYVLLLYSGMRAGEVCALTWNDVDFSERTILYHTDLGRKKGFSNGHDLAQFNWDNYDLVVIDESHNFRNANSFRNRETRYDFLLEKVLKSGVKTKVLMLSATPVNNRFADLKNQLALAYGDDYATFNARLETSKTVEVVLANAQKAFNEWTKLPKEERRAADLMSMLDIDFSILLDNVTIARSRKHITKYYDTSEIGQFPTRRKPISYYCDIAEREDTLEYKDIFTTLMNLTMGVYAPMNYIPMPPYDEIVKSLYDKDLSYPDATQICKVIYSKDNSKRFVVFESNKGFFKYTYEEICVFDELDWTSHFGYIDGIKPGWWESKNSSFAYSFFGTEKEAMIALKSEPIYKQFFE